MARIEPQSDVNVAVIGAAGYIGSCVINKIQESHPEWEISAADNFYNGSVRYLNDLRVEHVDIRNRRRLEDFLQGADLVIHLAAISQIKDCEQNPDLAYDINVTGTNNIAWFCRQTGAGLIFPSSMAVLGTPTSFPITTRNTRNPISWYGRTKLLNERSIKDFADDSFPAHIYMKSNVYGLHNIRNSQISQENVITNFIKQAIKGDPLQIYEPGTQSRNYVHVLDVAKAYVRSSEQILAQIENEDTGVEEYEIASDEVFNVMEIANIIRQQSDKVRDVEVELEVVDNPREGKEALVKDFTVDTSAAENQLNWQSERTVEESIRSMLKSDVYTDIG